MMKSNQRSPGMTLLAVWAALCFWTFTSHAQTLELRLVEREAAITRLFVTNAAGGNVNLQGSFDLENWFHIDSAEASQGVAAFTHANDEPIDTWFYRAVAGPAPVAINVGPKLDTNQFSGALILPETGGQVELTDANGVFYQLTVRSNSLSEPTAIRMTVITNFTDMPLSNLFRAAVAFEPDGLEFRGEAELKIRFPDSIPALEMVGYGFQEDGGGFHLRPWESTTNEVTLAITHFSGAGVGAAPFAATGPDRYAQGLKYTRDAIQEGDNWAGEQYRSILQDLAEGKITSAESDQLKKLVKRQRDLRVYLNGIKPLLAAAERDCEIGQVVLKRLDQLEGDLSGENIFYKEIVRVGPAIRCACARKYLDLCEKNAISGSAATQELTRLLDLVALKTGLIDDPKCDLGSDFDILARLAKGKCHKPWEGTIHYTKVFSSLLTLGADGFSHIVTESDSVSYVGRITELLEVDGDVLEDGAWQSWTMKLAGKFSGNRFDTETTTTVDPNFTVVDTTVTKGVKEMPAEGELIIRFDNGSFNFVSVGVGLGANQYSFPLQTTTERVVDCRKGPNCPESIPAKTTNAGTESLSIGRSPGVTTEGLTAEWQPNGSLKIVLKENDNEALPGGLNGFNKTEQTLTIQIRRGDAAP